MCIIFPSVSSVDKSNWSCAHAHQWFGDYSHAYIVSNSPAKKSQSVSGSTIMINLPTLPEALHISATTSASENTSDLSLCFRVMLLHQILILLFLINMTFVPCSTVWFLNGSCAGVKMHGSQT